MAIVTPSKAREILRRYDVRLSKRLGQHFLVDGNILNKEIAAAKLTSQDTVLEIGPGIGTLTAALASQVKKVVAIELDAKFITILKDSLTSFSNLKIVQGDALKLDLNSLLGDGPFKLVSNLPYNIATPVITKVLEECPQISLMVVMVQREIADRMTAKPGEKDYGVFTLQVQYWADVERVAEVSRHVFMPEPNVDSAIVRIGRLPRPRLKVSRQKALFDLIKTVFQQRRKTLRSVLLSTKILPPEEVASVLTRLEKEGISSSARAETLTLSQFALLHQVLSRAHLDL